MENVLDRVRTTYIGASDAAAVLGRSRWDTPISVWAKKTGQFNGDDGKNVQAKGWGKRHEPTIIAWFEEETGKKVVGSQAQHFHPDHSFLGATVDGLIDGEDAGFEAKTADAWKSKEWEGEEIPEEYILQCYHSMMVTGLRKWYIAVLIGGNNAHWKEVLWDERIILAMKEREIEFWNEFVVPCVMPTIVTKRDSDILSELFPVANEGTVVKLPDSANILVENLTALKQDYKNLESQIDLTENELKAMIKESEVGETSLYRIAWSNVRVRRFDTKAFELVHPELAAQFKPEKINRRFSYKQKKGA